LLTQHTGLPPREAAAAAGAAGAKARPGLRSGAKTLRKGR
jgi:hypothetical protein